MTTKRGDRGKPTVIGAAVVEGSPIVTKVPATGENGSLEAEIAYYRTHLPEWREHQGEHVLIRGAELHGFFPSKDLALAEGFRRFGRVTFLVHRVDLEEKPRPFVGVIL